VNFRPVANNVFSTDKEIYLQDSQLRFRTGLFYNI